MAVGADTLEVFSSHKDPATGREVARLLIYSQDFFFFFDKN